MFESAPTTNLSRPSEAENQIENNNLDISETTEIHETQDMVDNNIRYNLRDRNILQRPNYEEVDSMIDMNESQINIAMYEPTTIKQAADCVHSKHWSRAMQDELGSLGENGTWELV